MPADHAQFCRRRPVRRDEAMIVDAASGEFIKQTLAMVVIADKTGYARLTAKQCQVVSNVGSTTERFLGVQHMGDGYRCFWRDTRDLSIIVFIQHDIADHENLASLGLTGNEIV